jgi:hypothetical protein
MLPSNRKDAVKLKSRHYFTNKPCKHGHIAKRFTNCGVCAICLKNNNKYDKEYSQQYVSKNYQHLKKLWANYRAKNKEKLRQYKKENAAKINALNNKRYCLKIQRTPKWLTKQDILLIEHFYQEAQEKTKKYNEQYHVDHIIPLNGKNVSGLHVPNNLQVIKASDNLLKSNTFNME